MQKQHIWMGKWGERERERERERKVENRGKLGDRDEWENARPVWESWERGKGKKIEV